MLTADVLPTADATLGLQIARDQKFMRSALLRYIGAEVTARQAVVTGRASRCHGSECWNVAIDP